MSSIQHLYKDRTFSRTKQDEFFLSLTYKKRIYFHDAALSDDTYLDTSEELWSVRSQGKIYSFRFCEKLGSHADNLALINLFKWATAQFMSSYSIGFTWVFYRFFYRFLKYANNGEFHIKHCINYLEVLASQEEKEVEYYAIKRFVIFLIEAGAPTFDFDDIFLVEQLPIPKVKKWEAYYETEVKLKPYEVAFIQQKLAGDYANKNKLKISQLLNIIVLSLCFETGMRPVQLYYLHDDDFKCVDNKYFSVFRPWAKVGNRTKKRGKDRLEISHETGRMIQTLQMLRSEKGQLLRDSFNNENSPNRFTPMINSVLKCWGAEDVNMTAYDFRHSLAHTMAMQGATADEIAFILGHTSTVAAKHYISATPEIAKLKQKALGGNEFYREMVGMIMTGEIVEKKTWKGREALGEVASKLCVGIGGCAADSCKYHPVFSCYACNSYNPFLDGYHKEVLDALQEQVNEVIVLSDKMGQIRENPAVQILEGVIAQVKAVISRCELAKVMHNERYQK